MPFRYRNNRNSFLWSIIMLFFDAPIRRTYKRKTKKQNRSPCQRYDRYQNTTSTSSSYYPIIMVTPNAFPIKISFSVRFFKTPNPCSTFACIILFFSYTSSRLFRQTSSLLSWWWDWYHQSCARDGFDNRFDTGCQRVAQCCVRRKRLARVFINILKS